MKSQHFITFLTFLGISIATKFPPSFQKCDYKKSDCDQCLTRAIENAISQLSQPFKAVNLPSFEPLEVPSFSIGAGNGPVGVQQNFENAKLYGLRQGKVRNAALRLEEGNMYLNFTVLVPDFKILSQYHLSGKVLFIPVQGKGNVTIILKNITAMGHFPLEKFVRKGLTYIRSTTGKISLSTNLLHMNFENLYNGNKELGDAINKVLNENWDAIFEDVKSGYELFFKDISENLGNRFFSKVPLTEAVLNSDTSSGT